MVLLSVSASITSLLLRMKTVSILTRFAFSVLAVAIVVAMLLLPRLNSIQQDGVAPLGELEQPVSVVRDENGMAYVRANSLLDAIRAQGYVTAQDRLFQMQLTRCLLYTSPSPRDLSTSRMPSSA